MTAKQLWREWQTLERGKYNGERPKTQQEKMINLSGFMREFREILRKAAK